MLKVQENSGAPVVTHSLINMRDGMQLKQTEEHTH